MEEFGMHHVAAKFVPRILTADQKQQLVNICADLHQLASNDEIFLSRVITCDECWVYGYDPAFGENRPGRFTMTTPRLTLPSSSTSFWRKTRWLSSPTQHIPLIWHPVTSSYFKK